MTKRFTHIALLTTLLFSSLFAADAPVDMQQRTTELQNLKWGMFICWSFSTFSGKEWTGGVKDVSYFKATGCDTDQWARTAKEAGMGYILFLTKQHDGFCMWDTKTTDRKITKAPLGRDVLAEVKKSCDKYGIKLALYFSEGDWSWPGAKDGIAGGTGSGVDIMRAQLKELLTQYGPIEYFWMDCAAGHPDGDTHQKLNEYVKSIQPGCFIGANGSKAGDGSDLMAGEMGRPKLAPGFLVSEFTYPILPTNHDGGAMWFYSLPKHDGLCRSAKSLYLDYLESVKIGTIFSLDVGPNYEGKLRDIDVKTLRQVGDWIRDPSQAPKPRLPALSTGKPTTASSTWGAGHEADKATDELYDWSRWAAGKESELNNNFSAWLAVDLGKDEQIGRVEILEVTAASTREFTVEYKVGDTWKELARGTEIGEKVIDFPPVTARHVRLNILKAIWPPSIDDFRVLPPAAANK